MWVTRGFPGEITHQQSVIELKILRDREPHSITIAWCDRHRFTYGVFHVLKGKVNVALRRHQLKAVANGEFIFHRYRREVPLALTGKLTNKLLAVRD